MIKSPTKVLDHKLYLDIIIRASGQINDLITDLLEIGQPGEMQLGKYTIHQLLDEALAMTEDRILLKSITVRKDYSTMDCKIFANKQKIKIALANIIINAIDAMHPEKGKLKLITRSINGKCIIEIEDNGIGISKETVKNLFSPYFTNKAGGMGLGLSTTIDILKANHATVEVHSEEGKGTRFILSFEGVQHTGECSQGKRIQWIYNSFNTQDMEHYFKDKTVLVTGAGWGIGAATALLYATRGAKVIISDTSRRGGNDTLAKIKNQKGNATYIRTDVSNPVACEELIKRTIRTYGSIDIACNNSAVFCDTPHPSDWGMESSDNLAGLNLTSLNNCMKYEIEAMQKQCGGVIINTLSIISSTGLAASIPYIEAKYGTVTPLHDIPGRSPGIHIHTIPPQLIAVALLKEKLQRKIEGKIKLFSSDMQGTIQEVTRLILWLSSDETRVLSTVSNDTN